MLEGVNTNAMKFLIDNNLPPSMTAPFVAAGHDAVHLRDVTSGDSPDEHIALLAQQRGLVIVTRDTDFGDVRRYPPKDHPGLIVLTLPNTATVTAIRGVLTALLSQPDILANLPGRLAIVEFDRVRLTS